MARKTTTKKATKKVEAPVVAPVQTEEIVETVKVEETVAEAVETVAEVPAVETVEAVNEEVEEAKKAPAKKATTKKAVKATLYIQAAGKEVSYDDAIARVKDAWKEAGNKVGDLKEMAVYVKPEEEAIYYVINGDVTGKVEF